MCFLAVGWVWDARSGKWHAGAVVNGGLLQHWLRSRLGFLVVGHVFDARSASGTPCVSGGWLGVGRSLRKVARWGGGERGFASALAPLAVRVSGGWLGVGRSLSQWHPVCFLVVGWVWDARSGKWHAGAVVSGGLLQHWLRSRLGFLVVGCVDARSASGTPCVFWWLVGCGTLAQESGTLGRW